MQLLIIFLSVVLVLCAAFLILLILIQLPKKDAGAGLAFGGGATDALFGAGSGNALTKITKYVATFFLVLVLGLSILSNRVVNRGSRTLEMELEKSANAPAPLALPSAALDTTNQNTSVIPTNEPGAGAPGEADGATPDGEVSPTANDPAPAPEEE